MPFFPLYFLCATVCICKTNSYVPVDFLTLVKKCLTLISYSSFSVLCILSFEIFSLYKFLMVALDFFFFLFMVALNFFFFSLRGCTVFLLFSLHENTIKFLVSFYIFPTSLFVFHIVYGFFLSCLHNL